MGMAPTTYYTQRNGIGLVLTHHPNIQQTNGNRKPLNVGIVGLGVGTLAAYGQPGDIYRFYEIDPEIIALSAGTPPRFSFLAKSQAEIQVIPGDARLNLEDEIRLNTPMLFDVFVLDAFSGDAIPTHLLTLEAFQTYRQRLAPGGLAAIHVSGTHFYLAPLVLRQALETGFNTITYNTASDLITEASTWVLLSTDIELLQHFNSIRPATPMSAAYKHVPTWTDDYSNPLQLLNVFGKAPFLHIYARKEERP
jgi:spermidine synthase